MTDINATIFALRAPFPPDAVSWRVGSTNQDKSKGLALAYIDARDVMERLDDVVGPENWQNRYSHAANKTVCDLGIRIDGEWLWKANGAGDTDIEGEKGALSDALKRAAVHWGIGRYLYDLKSPWVRLEPFGRSYRIAKDEYGRLARVLEEHGTPPERSSQSLKRSDENGQDAWDRLATEVQNEFLDIKTLTELAELEQSYQKRVLQDRWPRAWKVSLRGLFDAKAQELQAAMSDGPDYPDYLDAPDVEAAE